MADGWHKYRGDTYYVKDGVVQRGKMKIKERNTISLRSLAFSGRAFAR